MSCSSSTTSAAGSGGLLLENFPRHPRTELRTLPKAKAIRPSSSTSWLRLPFPIADHQPMAPIAPMAPMAPVAAPVPSVLSSNLRTERQERFAGGGTGASTGSTAGTAGSLRTAATAARAAPLDPREVFANGAARFAGGGAEDGHGLHSLSPHGSGSRVDGSDGSGSLGVSPGLPRALPGESGGSVPMFGAGSALPGDSRKTWGPLPSKTFSGDPLQGTWRSQHVFASDMETKPGSKAESTSGNTPNTGKSPNDDETYSVDCGTTIFQPKDWHFTFRPPNTGDFNIPITVHQGPHQKSYQIARMELSVNANLDNWQPFQLRLIAPSRTSILLKESGTSECADLRCDFTEVTSCHSCTRPKETLSAFTGENALGTWMVAFEDKEGRKRTGLMAWAALKITWSCEPPIPP
mmetsp:Transcript_45647/g.72461  ORF Transcript_45647/g.72461 Transcript_45647/m.72461 type:complete len:408 (+) Transcript_45647:1398-2621(+)